MIAKTGWFNLCLTYPKKFYKTNGTIIDFTSMKQSLIKRYLSEVAKHNS